MKLELDYMNSIMNVFPIQPAYKCDITTELDSIIGVGNSISYWYRHFIKKHWTSEYFRVDMSQGKTVGKIFVDDKNVITGIHIFSDAYVGYPKDINEIMKKYIGEMLEGEYKGD